MDKQLGQLALRAAIERWALAAPLRITGHQFDAANLLVVSLEKDGHVGRGEACGVYYRDETADGMLKQLELVRPAIEAGIDRHRLAEVLPPGGARNALDCALWDLEAKVSGRPVWEIAGLREPEPLITTFTCGADTPENMASTALAYAHAQALKLKLTGEPLDAERVHAVRAARADVWLGVDANQGFARNTLERLMPVLVDARVALIEQPFPMGQEALLDGFRSPIPIAADESAQSIADLPNLLGRFEVINIKLDKCGGLTAGLGLAKEARRRDFKTMVGAMFGTSLAVAPAFLLGQLCTVVDLDAPVFFAKDRDITVEYTQGRVSCPASLWGAP